MFGMVVVIFGMVVEWFLLYWYNSFVMSDLVAVIFGMAVLC